MHTALSSLPIESNDLPPFIVRLPPTEISRSINFAAESDVEDVVGFGHVVRDETEEIVLSPADDLNDIVRDFT